MTALVIGMDRHLVLFLHSCIVLSCLCCVILSNDWFLLLCLLSANINYVVSTTTLVESRIDMEHINVLCV